MGRTEKSQGLAPPAIRKDVRAKHARNIINKVVPAILASNARARKGAESSELVANPGLWTEDADADALRLPGVENAESQVYLKRKGQGRRKAELPHEATEPANAAHGVASRGSGKKAKRSLDGAMQDLALAPSTTTSSPASERKTRIVTTDTLTAVRLLHDTKKSPNVCILNMASPLRPGGGVLAGATSQEEFLCARTTLLPSLKDAFYRLPELGGIWTSDVLVFRNALPIGDPNGELAPGERYFVDVVSAGMLRFPELEGEDDEVKRLSARDREVVEQKMRAVLRIAAKKKVKKLVLGAWGCGAYGNPVPDIARAWAKVLGGANSSSNVSGKRGKSSAKRAETWPSIEEVVFAINNRKMADDFARAYGGAVAVEAGPDAISEEEDELGDDNVEQELKTKIHELESQLSQVWNPDLKLRMGTILDGLRAQLADNGGQDNEFRLVGREDEAVSETGEEKATPDSTDEECNDELSENKGRVEI
jgi:uncharacterized protein (TIGR02452 family)